MDILDKEITLTYSPQLVQQAVFRYWYKSVGRLYWVALLFVALSLFITFSPNSWWTGFSVSILVIGIAFPILLYFVHHRNSMAKLRQMGTPDAKLILKEDGFTLSSGAGSSTLPWSSIEKIQQFENFWLLSFAKAHFSTLPLQTLSPEQKAFIIEHVTAAGGKVK